MTLKFDFTDYYRLTKPTDQQIDEWKDYMGSMTAADNRGLRIIMEATHSGVINRNDKFYIPSRMAEGVSTFRVGEKPTKMMKHHDPKSDPVGVIRGARFVPTIPDNLVDNPDIQNLMSSSAPIKTQLKSIRNLWRTGIFQEDGWRGLGYIELIGDVYDTETIKQIHDGRFDAVSTNFRSPGAAHCLICGQNWAADGFCEHEPFESYTENDDEDDKFKFPALPIPAIHKYLETSFVAFEGDELADIRIMDDANADNNKTIFLPDNFKWEEDLNYSTEPIFEFKDFEEEPMATPAKKGKITLSDAEQKVFDVIKKLREDIDEIIAGRAKEINALRGEDGFFPDQEEANVDDDTAILYALEDLETQDQEIDDAKVEEIESLYQEEFVKMHEEDILTEEELQDAKLSTGKRKSLPKTSFCGPNRSFPVPDCAHVTAARRLIGRYKGPGSKSNILACVSRKAKTLGCGASKDDLGTQADAAPVELLPFKEDSLKEMKDQDLRNLYMAAELELVGRGKKMAFECKECALHEEKVQKAQENITEAQDKAQKLEDILNILREELARTHVEYIEQVDQYVELKTSVHAEKIEKFAQIGVLTGKYDNLENAKDALKDKDIKTVEASFADFDIAAAAVKLNDGMTHEPKGKVKDPTAHIDGDNLQLPDSLSKPALMAIENIRELIGDGNIRDAKHLYVTMKHSKEFPDSLTFESLSAEIEPAE